MITLNCPRSPPELTSRKGMQATTSLANGDGIDSDIDLEFDERDLAHLQVLLGVDDSNVEPMAHP
jgi:hypothetical protein